MPIVGVALLFTANFANAGNHDNEVDESDIAHAVPIIYKDAPDSMYADLSFERMKYLDQELETASITELALKKDDDKIAKEFAQKCTKLTILNTACKLLKKDSISAHSAFENAHKIHAQIEVLANKQGTIVYTYFFNHKLEYKVEYSDSRRPPVGKYFDEAGINDSLIKKVVEQKQFVELDLNEKLKAVGIE